MKKGFLLMFLWLTAASLQAQTLDEIAAQPPKRLVNDYAQVLSEQERQALEQQLISYDDSTSTQIAILLLPTLGDWPVEEAALKVFRSWGIGNKKTNNGILILAAINDRKIRIEVGYGLEGAIPDITASQIIRNDIAPYFRNSAYYDGLLAATHSLIQAAAGEYKAPDGYDRRKQNPGFSLITVIVLLLLFLLFFRNRGGGGGFLTRRGYQSFGPPLFFPGSGGGWSSGGGGFGGFGGGSSGGGGASGNW